ncbi:MAG: sigma 54-interacting transcriptional regulator, partial [Blastocatellia bacterium]
LFGYQKGSFTGASSDKPGLFETAHGGTIFLDELGEMPAPMQVKLLRAIQEKEIVRVGATKPIKVDVRLIAATHRDLKAIVGTGHFRQDLFYRITTVRIEVPSLRQRTDDIPSLAQYFLEKGNKQGQLHRLLTLQPEAIATLAEYDWPDNVRELENVINRLIVLTHGSTITGADVKNAIGTDESQPQIDEQEHALPVQRTLVLPSSICEFLPGDTMATFLRRIKLTALEAAMAEYHDRQAAAERVGMAEDTVRKLLRYSRLDKGKMNQVQGDEHGETNQWRDRIELSDRKRTAIPASEMRSQHAPARRTDSLHQIRRVCHWRQTDRR